MNLVKKFVSQLLSGSVTYFHNNPKFLCLPVRSSRSIFNSPTLKLISHPITQQLPPNWLLSCLWLCTGSAKVQLPRDYVICTSIGRACGGIDAIITKARKVRSSLISDMRQWDRERQTRQWGKYLQEQLKRREPEEQPEDTGQSRAEWRKRETQEKRQRNVTNNMTEQDGCTFRKKLKNK